MDWRIKLRPEFKLKAVKWPGAKEVVFMQVAQNLDLLARPLSIFITNPLAAKSNDRPQHRVGMPALAISSMVDL